MGTNAPALVELVTRRVLERTGRRVRNLRVEVGTGEVGNGWLRLCGQAPSYYVKQLAQHAVRETVPTARLENAITVA